MISALLFTSSCVLFLAFLVQTARAWFWRRRGFTWQTEALAALEQTQLILNEWEAFQIARSKDESIAVAMPTFQSNAEIRH